MFLNFIGHLIWFNVSMFPHFLFVCLLPYSWICRMLDVQGFCVFYGIPKSINFSLGLFKILENKRKRQGYSLRDRESPGKFYFNLYLHLPSLLLSFPPLIPPSLSFFSSFLPFQKMLKLFIDREINLKRDQRYKRKSVGWSNVPE